MITEIEWNKDIEKMYADVEFTFTYYFKYDFYFEAPSIDGVGVILICVGGDPDDIYKCSIEAKMKLKDIPLEVSYCSMTSD